MEIRRPIFAVKGESQRERREAWDLPPSKWRLNGPREVANWQAWVRCSTVREKGAKSKDKVERSRASSIGWRKR